MILFLNKDAARAQVARNKGVLPLCRYGNTITEHLFKV